MLRLVARTARSPSDVRFVRDVATTLTPPGAGMKHLGRGVAIGLVTVLALVLGLGVLAAGSDNAPDAAR